MDSLRNIMNIGKQYLSSYTSFTRKMHTLKRKRDSLRSHESDIIAQLQHVESSSSKKRRKVVEDWLGNVEKTINKVENMEVEVSRISGLLGSVKLANRVEDLTKEVDELVEQGQVCQGHGLTLDALDEVELLAPKLVGQAFERNLEAIWEHLRNDEVLIIGVWGMGGVGKTTLVSHVHNRIQKQPDTFEHVYWITVSQNPSVRKLQDDIAKAINFDISIEDDERKRAAMVSRELKRRARSVLILDDVWNDICLERMGIATAVNGCKLLITTRSLDVCRRLCCDEKIWIQPLSKEESWYLFEKTLRHPKMALTFQVLEVAKSVAQECDGLPLGIITLASCMREVDNVHEWRNALQALKESEDVLMKEKVFKVLEFSYNSLNDTVVQKCFLYCALYPEDDEIKREELIQYLIDERLIEKIRDRQAQFDRGHAILNKLVNSCLLEAVNECYYVGGPEGVKMHDLVRDMAIKIIGPQFMVKAGMQLEEMPKEQEWSEDVERVSLMQNNIGETASGTSPRCPKLLTLFLSENYHLKRIDNSFFEHMPALQVLNISNCSEIEELPRSVSIMKSLSALVLSSCSMLRYMPSLAELTSLNRLDLRWSGIREVPHGLEMLVNLTYLDLSHTQNLEAFPTGVLPKLGRLEYLKFDLHGARIEDGLEIKGAVKILGEEFRRLERLSTFRGRLIFCDNVNEFKQYVMSRRQYVRPKCCSYEYILDGGNEYVQETCDYQHNLNQVCLQRWSLSKRAEEDATIETLETLLKDVWSLKIARCKDARSLSDVWWLDDVTHNLKRCYIHDCEGIECVGSFHNPLSSFPRLFQTLEILELKNLQNLRILFELEEEGERPILPPSLPVFSCLKRLTIMKCVNVKKLFGPDFLPYLPNLEEIHVFDCSRLEEIIAAEAEEKESSTDDNNYRSCYSNVEYTLPKLKALYLTSLPELESICEGTLACDALEEIYVYNCPRLRRIPLSRPPSSLRSIYVDGRNVLQWWESVEWEDPDAMDLFQPYRNLGPY